MPQSSLLPPDLWLLVLNYLDYFDLCSMKRVNKQMHDCCRARSVEEDLFIADYQEDSIKTKFQSGKKDVEVHPVLTHSLYLLENGIDSVDKFGKPWNGEFWVKKVNGKFSKSSKLQFLDGMGDLGHQNATNPPIYHLAMLNWIWDTDTLRSFVDHFHASSRAIDAAEDQHYQLDEAPSASSSKPAYPPPSYSHPPPSSSRNTQSSKRDIQEENTSRLSNPKAVTVKDILEALAVYFEKAEGQLEVDWVASSLNSYDGWGKCFLDATEDIEDYDPDPEGWEARLEEWSNDWAWEWDNCTKYGADEEKWEQEEQDERFCKLDDFWKGSGYEAAEEQKESKPLCACFTCQSQHPWNEKCWEKFIQAQETTAGIESLVEAAKEAFQMRSCRLFISQFNPSRKLQLCSTGEIVADLKDLRFAQLSRPEWPLRLRPLTAEMLQFSPVSNNPN